MIEVRWIRLDVGIFEDEKIKIVLSMPEGRTLLIIWLKLLCLAGRINNSGVLMINKTIPYTIEMLSAVFNETEKMMRLAVDVFQKLGMVEQFNGTLLLPNWEKHQSIDALEKIKEDSRSRSAKYRQKQALLTSGDSESDVTVTLQSRDGNGQVTQQTKTKTKSKTKTIDTESDAKGTGADKLPGVSERFDALWELYPCKQGRISAYKAYEKAVKAGAQDEDIRRGIEAYIAYIQGMTFESRYIKHGSTFFNQQAWADDYTVRERNGYGKTKAEPAKVYVDTDGSWG